MASPFEGVNTKLLSLEGSHCVRDHGREAWWWITVTRDRMKQISVSSSMPARRGRRERGWAGGPVQPHHPQENSRRWGKHKNLTTSFSTGHYNPSSSMDLRAHSTWFLRGLLWASSPVWVPGAWEGLSWAPRAAFRALTRASRCATLRQSSTAST